MNNKLSTEFIKTMDTACPWGDYPRPQFKRESYICLNGEWNFEFSKEEPLEYTKKILVPFPPESALSNIEKKHLPGTKLYYKRSFSIPSGFKKDRIILHFGAVDQVCNVILNGKKIGSHEGGYIPFSFDITDHVLPCGNELKVIVTDDLDLNYPYGKQRENRGGMWYTPVSGIWQTVWLESLPENPIEEIKITPSTDSVKIEVKSNSKQKTITLQESNEKFTFCENSCVITPKEVKKWTPEAPHLYYFTLETDTDKIESYFALREISVKKCGGVSKICLNGEPYLFNGLLDQGYFPDGIFLPPTAEGYENDILTAKRLGFNMLRKHIKIEPAVFYHLCDKLGMVVFQDFVNNSDYSFFRDTALPTIGFKQRCDKRLHKNIVSRKIFTETALDTVSLLYNSPSVLYYTIFNEGWGQFLSDGMYQKIKNADNTRIIDSTSGWFTGKMSDVISHHIYFKKLKAKVNPLRPTVISEFGGISHRCDGHVFSEKNYGYTTVADRAEFENRVYNLYLSEVLPLVKQGVCALVYTQLSDVEDETNGFMTYDRKILKVNADRFRNLSLMLTEAFKEGQEK
jgi:beta-galactosidase/beta-glucuronidase